MPAKLTRTRKTKTAIAAGLPVPRESLNVRPDGRIDGSAMGWEITGSWSWTDGYFCREMDWSGMEIDFNCQLVEAEGIDKMRFTVDQGKGDSAVFRLR